MNPSLSAIYDLVIDGEFVSDWKRSWSLPIRGSRDYLDYDLSIIEDLDCAHATYRWPVVFNLGGARLFAAMGVLCGIFRKQRSMLTGVAG